MTTREQFLADAIAVKELENDITSEADRDYLTKTREQIHAARTETLQSMGHQALLPNGISAPLEEVRQEQELGHDMTPGSGPQSH